MSEREPTVVVVSAPSGAGKTTVLGRVLKTDPKLVLGREFPLLDVMGA